MVASTLPPSEPPQLTGPIGYDVFRSIGIRGPERLTDPFPRITSADISQFRPARDYQPFGSAHEPHADPADLAHSTQTYTYRKQGPGLHDMMHRMVDRQMTESVGLRNAVVYVSASNAPTVIRSR